jgi:hypothetical protein
MQDIIKTITQTVEGYPVKNLKFNQLDNIIVGQVKCPVIGRPELHDGYVTLTWRRNGTCIKIKDRPDLKLDIKY